MAGRHDRLPADPAAALFVYGTLLFPGILVSLIGRVPGSTPGTLAGWRAAALPGRAYPGLVRAGEAASAEGRLLTGLTAAEWRVIDAFEDGGYDLTPVTIADGRPGWAYTWTGAAAPLPEDWSAERFATEHLAEYVARCTTWRRNLPPPLP
jgi:hypothetical protein